MKFLVLSVAGFLLAAALYITGVCLAVHLGRYQIRCEAISLGHAQYNPTNANFEWKAVKP